MSTRIDRCECFAGPRVPISRAALCLLLFVACSRSSAGSARQDASPGSGGTDSATTRLPDAVTAPADSRAPGADAMTSDIAAPIPDASPNVNADTGTGPADRAPAASDRAGAETDPSARDAGPDSKVAPDSSRPDAEAGTTAVLAKPGPTNTGVPAGVTLKPSGSLTITTDGQIVNGLSIDGCVNVQAKNVVIRNTLIRCTDYYPVRIFDGASLTIEDSEIAASGGFATSGIAFANYTARRINVHGAADGLKSDSNVLVEDSWIHDNWLGKGDHADGAQSTGGDNVVFRHNFIDIVDHGSGHGGAPNSCFQVGNEGGADSHFVIDGNWLYGGGWVINMGGGGPGNQIVNNRFGRGKAQAAGQPDYPEYGPISDRDGKTVITGNVWDDTGAPIP